MADAARARKLAVRIREIVASTLKAQVKDPRLGMVTVTDAKVTPDLREAEVFYTVFGGATEQQASAIALESAKGVLRSAVGRQTGVKFTPTLTFTLDMIPDTARQIEDLLAAARAADAEVQRAAAAAVPAGDPDPYRVPANAADDGDGPDGARDGARDGVRGDGHDDARDGARDGVRGDGPDDARDGARDDAPADGTRP
jgi:ribosome-binding factor A